MLNSIPVAFIVGTTFGVLAGLGIGGGSLLILWLTLIVGMPQYTAAGINLLFFIPSAIIASLFRWKQGVLDIKRILPAMIAACISAGLFCVLRRYIPTGIIKKIFGGLLLLTGLREIFYRPRNAK